MSKNDILKKAEEYMKLKYRKTARMQDVSGSSLHLKAELKFQNRLMQRNTPVSSD